MRTTFTLIISCLMLTSLLGLYDAEAATAKKNNKVIEALDSLPLEFQFMIKSMHISAAPTSAQMKQIKQLDANLVQLSKEQILFFIKGEIYKGLLQKEFLDLSLISWDGSETIKKLEENVEEQMNELTPFAIWATSAIISDLKLLPEKLEKSDEKKLKRLLPWCTFLSLKSAGDINKEFQKIAQSILKELSTHSKALAWQQEKGTSSAELNYFATREEIKAVPEDEPKAKTPSKKISEPEKAKEEAQKEVDSITPPKPPSTPKEKTKEQEWIPRD